MDTQYGAVRANNTRKPVFNAFQTFGGQGDVLPGDEQCGDFQAPDITIASPTEGAVFATSLPIEASAKDGTGVARISVYADDSQSEIRNFTDKNAPATLDGKIEWQGAKQLPVGTHKITVQAIDPMGNVGTKSVTVTKVDPSKLKAIRTLVSLKLSGKGAKRTLKVSLVPGTRGLTNLLGKLQVVFQKKAKGKWKTAHKYAKTAKGADKRAAAFKVKLKKAQWRVQVIYTAKAGTSYGSAKSVFKKF